MKHLFQREQLIRRPRRDVFAFFADPLNLERLTPDFRRVAIESAFA
jgi:ligand-binding SRPBCC domain-containing protein